MSQQKQKEREIALQAEKDAQVLKDRLEWETDQKLKLERNKRIAAEKAAAEEADRLQKEQLLLAEQAAKLKSDKEAQDKKLAEQAEASRKLKEMQAAELLKKQ